ncbi:class IIb bacteriocin, lactobin A/cerein 7B family [Streptococcus tangpeifui]|uniref:class IIb bacteriocin, lactobin A/cerein 7B family n=1 Tax=Streptococcus tangpeifui TaxID=2709400 RepID=UPI0013EAAFE3|nr:MULTISPECIES: class IIb bacteriocin, lactobin A/cerein 7B family [unclassified Streptococcus]
MAIEKFDVMNIGGLATVEGGGAGGVLTWGGLLTAYGLGYAAGQTVYNLTH